MLKILPMILRALMLLTMIYSLNAIAAEPAALEPKTSDTQPALTAQPDALPLPQSKLMDPSTHNAFSNIPPEILSRMSTDDISDIMHMQMKKPESAIEVIFNKQIIVPGMVFGSFVAMVFFIAYYSYRKRKELMLLVHESIKSGHPLPATFLESLEYKKKPTADSDLRKSLILIALGLSSIVIIFFVADAHDKPMAAVGILPFLIGLAYLFLWKNAQPKDLNDAKPKSIEK
ncbi:MAG: hypothetical protein EOP07_22100 [Proteobacteria bacterium]|nr:MAG: hypothetical protein EOP07_22100 [Pseudomonadota bacterium]